MTRVIGYPRVSTDEQTNGCSLEAQEAKIRQYCDLYSLELIDVVADPGQSAKNLDRPGLKKVLARIKRGEADGIVVAKLDRLSRNVGDWSKLINDYFGEKGGKHLFSVGEQIDTTSANGRMVLNIIMSISAWEREIISERTRAALRHKMSKGERCGNVPYGKRLADDGKHLVDDPAEQRVIKLICRLRSQDRTLKAITEELTRRGHRRRNGGEFDIFFVHSALKRAAKAKTC